ncbi:riboflavin biosynthesis protein RibF [Ferrimicrobium sp.]|uniref:riboflavin biosynthesis protein RibF n=1 Tax=Ferrimicrobium sp. TaxID=2926050 RepID=UPI0026092F79|nr:riboflavin biosynthesis protein RibF [Ferrimicrobium sp.]
MIEVLSSESPTYTLERSVVTIGAFDGFHLGHLGLIGAAREEATRLSLPLVVVTFDQHPLKILAPERAPRLLMGSQLRHQLLTSVGVDVLYLLHFDTVRAAQAPVDFVDEVLVATLGAVGVYVGENFTYGARGAGSISDLIEQGVSRGFSVHASRLLTVGELIEDLEAIRQLGEDKVVSATLIRTLIQEGQLDLANELLGHPFGLEGVVVAGDQRGRTLGFPTANVVVGEEFAKPPDAVYAGYTYLGHQRYPVAISLGTRPMYYPEGGARLLEVFVIGADEDLYDRELCVYLLAKLREQQVFDSESDFRQQMERDVLDAIRTVEAWPSFLP